MVFLFFVSGIAALIYQIVWTKELALIFGITLFATSAVVTAFMAGLAFGSLYFGRLVDRWKKPLVLFALLEAGIAAFAFLFPFILVLLRRIYVVFYGPFGDNHYVMSLVRFALVFVVLFVPTSLMGGTLPVILRAYIMRSKRLGRDVASLYAANNIGAFLGCIVAGYVLLEWLGPLGSLKLAAALNLGVVAIALLLSKQVSTRIEDQEAPEPEEARGVDHAAPALQPGGLSRPVKVALWVFGLEGVTSLVYQMAWMRLLVFFVSVNIYGVTAIIGTYLIGLSLGAFLSKRWVDRMGNPYRTLGLIEVGIGLTALATIPVLPFLLDVHRSLVHLKVAGLSQSVLIAAAKFGVTFCVILVPTAFMGATLPVVSGIYVGELGRLGRKMGVLGCLDTVGSIFGAFAGGFIMIPLLGIQRTIIIAALVNLALAGWMFAVNPASRRRLVLRAGFGASALGVVFCGALLFVKPVPLVKYSRILKGHPDMELVQYEEDLVASVSVVEKKGYARTLWLDDNEVAITSPHDRSSHEMVLHVPLLLHPEPKRALIIGLGLGLGVGTCLEHDVNVDVVELSRGVVEVNPCFDVCFEDYRREHGGKRVLSDPRTSVRIEDGRNFVIGTDEKYDVIHVGGFHPITSSNAAGFYTVEFYQDCQRVLTPDGIFTEWLPIHGNPIDDFATIFRSFRQGFPYTSVWYKYNADFCMLLGSKKPLEIDFQDVERRMSDPAVRRHLARSNVEEVYDLLDFFCLGPEGIDRAVGDGPLHTDKHPCVEYHRFRLAPGDRTRCLALMADDRERIWPSVVNVPESRREEVEAQFEKWFQGTNELLLAQRMEETAEFDETARVYLRALELNPADKNAQFLWKRYLARHYRNMAEAWYSRNRPYETIECLRLAAETSPDTYWGAEAKQMLIELRGRLPAPPQ